MRDIYPTGNKPQSLNLADNQPAPIRAWKPKKNSEPALLIILAGLAAGVTLGWLVWHLLIINTWHLPA
jgi:hypothetical protein